MVLLGFEQPSSTVSRRAIGFDARGTRLIRREKRLQRMCLPATSEAEAEIAADPEIEKSEHAPLLHAPAGVATDITFPWQHRRPSSQSWISTLS